MYTATYALREVARARKASNWAWGWYYARPHASWEPRFTVACACCSSCTEHSSAIHQEQYAIDRGTLVTKYYTHDEPLFRLPASAQ